MAAIVVGVSYVPGIGFAVAKRFAQAGLRVGIVGRTEEKLKHAKAEIEAMVPGAQVTSAVGDVTDKNSIDAAFMALIYAMGAPSVLVYNVSSRPFPTSTVADVDPERLLNDYRAGPLGAVHCAQAVIPGMREAGEGTIIFTGATASMRGAKGFGSFSASKAGLRALAQSLAKEEMNNGIHVVHAVVDGMVDMPAMRGYAEANNIPQGRLIDTEAIAETYFQMHMQDKRCMSFEIDIRPYLSDGHY